MKTLVCGTIVVVGISLAAVNPDEQPAESEGGMTLRLELFVDDMQKSVDFYTDVLGFEKLDGDRDYQPVQSGSVVIGLGAAHRLEPSHYFNPEIQTARHGLGAEIVLEVDDVKAAYRRVQTNRRRVLSPLARRPWGLTDFRIADPDGYYLRITSRE